MKMIILAILLSSKAEDISEHSSRIEKNIYSSFSEETLNKMELSSNFHLSTIENEIVFDKEEWFNVNKGKKSSSLSWRKISENWSIESTYILRSERQCLRQICLIKLQYNGSLSRGKEGCLSFILWTRGQPIGQLWIEDDQDQQSFLQKIQLTNSSLRVEHSLKSSIKNLSINTRILFDNSQMDSITLSNLNINWKGSCSIDRSEMKSSENLFTDSSTLTDNSIELTSESFSQTSSFITNERSEKDSFVQSLKRKEFFSSINEKNVGWIFFLIILFCFLILFSSILYGLWTIEKHYRFIWYIPFNSPIEFVFRRSVRSSRRSIEKIQTLSQISKEISFDQLTNNSSQ